MKSKLRKSLNRYDKFNYTFYRKVQKGFLKLANRNKNKYLIIDSNLEIKQNESFIVNKISKII